MSQLLFFIYLNLIRNVTHSGQFAQHKLNTYSNQTISLDSTSAPLNTLPFHYSLYNTWGAAFHCVLHMYFLHFMHIVFFCPSSVHILCSVFFCCCLPQPRKMKRSGILPPSLSCKACMSDTYCNSITHLLHALQMVVL